MKIRQLRHSSPLAEEYAEIIKSEWREDFLWDFYWEYFSWRKNIDEFQLYIAYDWSTVYGWAILSKDILLNPYSDPWKTKRKKQLAQAGYKCLTYVIVSPKYQNQSIGATIIRFLLKDNSKIWLTCTDELIDFYEKLWFHIDIPKSETSSTTLMIHSQ